MAATTLGSLARQQLAAVADGLSLPVARREGLVGFLDDLAEVIGLDDVALDRPPRWSAVGDDASPFEWSFVPGRSPDVRLLVEAQADPASPTTYWEAARRLTDWCVERGAADTGRLREVEDLYAPTDPLAYQACWHGFDFAATAADPTVPLVKLYLNPCARGRSEAPTTVRETLSRLGFRAALESLGPVLDRHAFVHCSLDLDGGDAARVKLYARVHSRPEMDALYRLGRVGDRGDVGWLCHTLGIDDAWSRTGFCVLHFVDPDDDRPARTVVNLPVPDLIGDDRRAGERISVLLADRGVDPAPYQAVMAGLASAEGPADATVASGRHSFLSFQRHQGASRLTVYLGARAYLARYGRLAFEPARWWPSPVADDGHPRHDELTRSSDGITRGT